jgi:hypothetical protein
MRADFNSQYYFPTEAACTDAARWLSRKHKTSVSVFISGPNWYWFRPYTPADDEDLAFVRRVFDES